MTWIVYEEEKARTAGCRMDLDQVVYALTVAEVADAYDRARNEGVEYGDQPISRWAAWEELDPDARQAIIKAPGTPWPTAPGWRSSETPSRPWRMGRGPASAAGKPSGPATTIWGPGKTTIRPAGKLPGGCAESEPTGRSQRGRAYYNPGGGA